jgi:hypothetical protein
MSKLISTHFFYLKTLSKAFVLSIILLSFCRLFFWFYNKDILPTPSFSDFFWALRFDASAIAYAQIPLALCLLIPLSIRPLKAYRWIQKAFFILSCLILMSFELTDVAYFRFANRRLMAGDLGLIQNALTTLPKLLTAYLPLFLLAFVLILILNFIYKKTIDNNKNEHPSITGLAWVPQIAIFIAGLAFWVVILRGAYNCDL